MTIHLHGYGLAEGSWVTNWEDTAKVEMKVKGDRKSLVVMDEDEFRFLFNHGLLKIFRPRIMVRLPVVIGN